jgi:hypothetical protein
MIPRPRRPLALAVGCLVILAVLVWNWWPAAARLKPVGDVMKASDRSNVWLIMAALRLTRGPVLEVSCFELPYPTQ